MRFSTRISKSAIGFVFVAAAAMLPMTSPLAAQVVATYGFEDGTADGWTSFNGATTPVASNAAAEAGSFSLLTTTGATGQGGPSVLASSILQAGAKYTITGFVQMTPGESPTNANFTVKRTDPTCSGGTCFDTVGAF